jgi:hypothetical protein
MPARKLAPLDLANMLLYYYIFDITYYYDYKHTRRHYAFISSKTMHQQQCSHGLFGHPKHSQANHHKPLQTSSHNTPQWAHACQPEPRPTGLCNHSKICTLHCKNAHTQPYTKACGKHLQQRMPDPPRQGQLLHCPAHVGVSLPAGLSARNSPRRMCTKGQPFGSTRVYVDRVQQQLRRPKLPLLEGCGWIRDGWRRCQQW